MKRVRPWMLVCAVAFAASAPSLRNGFVYDDVPVAQEDPRIRSFEPGRLLAIPYWGDEFHDRIYRPFTTLSLAVDWQLGGGRGAAWPFHLTNVLLHLVATALVLALARRVVGSAGATLAALWFAVHPVHVEAFAGIVGRAELLAAAAYLGAVLAFDVALENRRSGSSPMRHAGLVLATLACAALAYGAKEHALTLPAALVLTAWWRARQRAEPAGSGLKQAGVLVGGVLVLATFYLAARAAVLGTMFGGGAVAAGLDGLDVTGRALVMLPALLVWLRLLAWPVHLAADYSPNAFEPHLAAGGAHFVALLLLALFVWVAWAARRRMPGLTFGLAWCAITGAIAANVAFPTGVLVAERVLYLPSVGAALALGALWERLPVNRWTWPATTVVLVALAARTLERVGVWRENGRFFATLEHDAPASYRARWMAGTWAFRRGEQRTGERLLLSAMRIYPADPVLVGELGAWYLQAGRFTDADRFLSAALRADSMMADVASRALLARRRAGRADSAAALARAVHARFPDHPAVLLGAFTAFLEAGDSREALAMARRLTFLEPDRWQHHQLRADAALRLGRCDEARAALHRAVALAPPPEPAPRDMATRLEAAPACRPRRP